MSNLNPVPDSKSTPNRHAVIFDPMPFHGGSKVATQAILSVCDEPDFSVSVITAHPRGWQEYARSEGKEIKILTIPFSSWMSSITGRAFYLVLLFRLCLCMAYLTWLPKATLLIGTTQPGSDMVLYLLKTLLKLPIIQFIHGPVGNSRSVAWCLKQADQIYYLESTKASIQLALSMLNDGTQLRHINATPFINGLSVSQWPSLRQQSQARVFWAASLLKWKNLDLLTAAIKSMSCPVEGDICYIKPSSMISQHDQCAAPQPVPTLSWHEQPDNLDDIRKQCSIFVSTSTHEPFGLSVLEAMATGLCPVIPEDGAYWDQVLTDNVDCLKYQANNAQSLADKLVLLSQSPLLREEISIAALEKAQNYRADICYHDAAHSISILSQPMCLRESSHE
ncbi:glycosyltransferase family 4 protein [Vibrio cionasavignyae]|uniref:glycosyltransferase family 4 protein n=1 Tax=Vibrio cionasavignyae TaxID=2910252 RepID=UPI003D101709